MKERPILFSAPMVRAILEGRKTQTRRIVSGLWRSSELPSDLKRELVSEDSQIEFRDGILGVVMTAEQIANSDWLPGKVPEPGWLPMMQGKGPGGRGNPTRCPYGEIGDELWVKEAWRAGHYWNHLPPSELPIRDGFTGRIYIDYLADPPRTQHGRNRASIHMPRWLSRINLQITKVRVERLQEITSEDAIAEGIQVISHGREGNYYHPSRTEQNSGNYVHAEDAYRELWDEINAAAGFGWESNPWVWVIEFKDDYAAPRA